MIYNILQYGAVPGSVCTSAIQAALDECFRSGGGTVVIPAGDYITGGIRLRSNTTLLLEDGAHLIGSRNPEDYYGWKTDTLEPVNPAYISDLTWLPPSERSDPTMNMKPCCRWSNGLIRAIDAENIAVIGEGNAVIDGRDCYDANGEEHYRGPHAISMHHCRNIRLEGYTVKDSANWAQAIFFSENITAKNLRAIAGHDGIHLTGCDNVTISGCVFETGDDCIAGIDNCGVTVTDTVCNTACSAFRFGGTDVLIENCKMIGPARYLFRGSLTREEKAASAPSLENTDGILRDGAGHRFNMLSGFTYYADFSCKIRRQPGNITIRNCEIINADRLLHYNFSGNETWQKNRPLSDVTFEKLTARGIRLPLNAYGDSDVPLTLVMRDCSVEFAEVPPAFMHLCHHRRVTLDGVTVQGTGDAPLIRRWSDDGVIELCGCNVQNDAVIDADEPFFAKSI
ncbi:MAG: hypothetical protein IJ037_00575 [Clostridia bacterium]|nr:hypothetical protein [Clostridia bacterium]